MLFEFPLNNSDANIKRYDFTLGVGARYNKLNAKLCYAKMNTGQNYVYVYGDVTVIGLTMGYLLF